MQCLKGIFVSLFFIINQLLWDMVIAWSVKRTIWIFIFVNSTCFTKILNCFADFDIWIININNYIGKWFYLRKQRVWDAVRTKRPVYFIIYIHFFFFSISYLQYYVWLSFVIFFLFSLLFCSISPIWTNTIVTVIYMWNNNESISYNIIMMASNTFQNVVFNSHF